MKSNPSAFETIHPTNIARDNEAGVLKEKRQAVKLRLERIRRIAPMFYIGILAIAFIILLILLFAPLQIEQRVVLALYIIPFVTAPIVLRERVRQLENEIQELDFQIDLEDFSVGLDERRAEKILRLNNYQLRRYYDQNLMHNHWIFLLGIVCILLGIGVIAGSIAATLYLAEDIDVKIITGVLGAISAIMTNYVAALYLRMNSVFNDNLAQFHTKLVESQKTLLGNLLASKNEDDDLRHQTLAALAEHLVKGNRSAIRG